MAVSHVIFFVKGPGPTKKFQNSVLSKVTPRPEVSVFREKQASELLELVMDLKGQRSRFAIFIKGPISLDEDAISLIGGQIFRRFNDFSTRSALDLANALTRIPVNARSSSKSSPSEKTGLQIKHVDHGDSDCPLADPRVLDGIADMVLQHLAESKLDDLDIN